MVDFPITSETAEEAQNRLNLEETAKKQLMASTTSNRPIKRDLAQISEIEDMIRQEARKSGVDETLAVNIAYSESGLDPKAKSKTSSATGLFQIIKGTWKEFKCEGDREVALDNIRCAMKIIKTSGYHHWLESYDMKGNGWKYLPANKIIK